MRYLASIVLALTLIFGINVPMVEASAPVVNSTVSSVEHVSADPKDPKPNNKGKKKGHYKRQSGQNKFSSELSSRSVQYDNDGNGKGKEKGKKKNGKKTTPKGKSVNRKKGTGKTAVKPFVGNGSSSGPVTRQAPVRCVIIEQPIETRVEYRTRTVTDRVVYGAGLVALGAVVAGLLALFYGFILGWRRAGKNEDEFLNSVLHEDTETS